MPSVPPNTQIQRERTATRSITLNNNAYSQRKNKLRNQPTFGLRASEHAREFALLAAASHQPPISCVALANPKIHAFTGRKCAWPQKHRQYLLFERRASGATKACLQLRFDALLYYAEDTAVLTQALASSEEVVQQLQRTTSLYSSNEVPLVSALSDCLSALNDTSRRRRKSITPKPVINAFRYSFWLYEQICTVYTQSSSLHLKYNVCTPPSNHDIWSSWCLRRQHVTNACVTILRRLQAVHIS